MKIYALKNFPLYGIPSLLDTEIHGRTLAALWSVNKDRDNDYKDLRPFLHALTTHNFIISFIATLNWAVMNFSNFGHHVQGKGLGKLSDISCHTG